MGDIPYGICKCGICGLRTPIATRGRARLGHIKGQPLDYILGHNPTMRKVRYAVEDHGYETPCWISTLKLQPNGYGKVTVNKVSKMAHVHAWEEVNGPVPEGKEIHHKCHTKPCINPEHLDCLTPEEHRLIHVAERTHCSFGHEWTKANTYVTKKGARYCRACKARRQRKHGYDKYWRQKGGILSPD